MQLEIIGTVHSCFKEKFGTPRQGSLVPHAQGYIEFSQRWDPYKSLQGLAEFSHGWLVFWFHNNPPATFRPLVNPPRLAASQRVGVFASRSPLRPNPLGLSLVKIEKVVGARLYISGLDVIDGTPVIDFKPYIHAYDSVADSRNGWLNDISSEAALEVTFSSDAEAMLGAQSDPHLRQTLVDILSADIRNRSDKRSERDGKRLGFYHGDYNVVFQVAENRVEVLRIESL